MAKISKTKAKKEIIEFNGTKLEKVCCILQFTVLILIIGLDVFARINGVNSDIVNNIYSYGILLILVLLLVPIIFKQD